jgi:hypothetical protein
MTVGYEDALYWNSETKEFETYEVMLRKGKAKQRERLQQQKVKKYTAEEIRQQREGGA